MSSEVFTETIEKTNEQSEEILLFYIDNELYGIEIQYITEIIGIQPITFIPKVPDCIKGVINIRGKVVPVISVRRKFYKEEIPYDERTCIIVVEMGEISVGLIVDRVREVLTVSESDVVSTPAYKNVNVNQYIKNIVESFGETKLILNIHKLIMEQI